MVYFGFLLIALLVTTAIHYTIFFGFIYYWHEKKTSVVILPLIHTFEFFITGFLVVCLASILLYYLPDIIKHVPDLFINVGGIPR